MRGSVHLGPQRDVAAGRGDRRLERQGAVGPDRDVHEQVIAACDCHRYKFLGVEGYHDNCTDNLHAGLAEIGPRRR
jgi:uncharacterized protein YcgI (DUF1989 family)